MPEPQRNSRERLIAATIDLVRANGYATTRVEDVCAAAGVTKGSFFHHFASKDELALAAAGYWDAMAGGLFAAADYNLIADPVARLLAYVDLRRALITGEHSQYSCFAGTMIQETHETHPELRDACAVSIANHVTLLEALIEAALRVHPVKDVDAESLAIHLQAVTQGAFVMAKARQDRRAAIASIDHLYRYLELLFAHPPRGGRRSR
jgi:TetR/AcrR family transcriptional repressor of nem operon